MNIRIENGHGRHLGTYNANDNIDAAEQYARASGYRDIEDAEKPKGGIPLFKMDRLEFIDERES